MTKKGKVFLGLGLFILIAGGTGAGLALFFTGTFDKKVKTIVNTTPPVQPQEVTEDGKDKVNPENLPINNSENSTPSKRNDISINCDYQRVWKDVNATFGYWTYEERSKVADINNESISCVVKLGDEKLNTYPVFTYDDIEDHLSFSSELYDFKTQIDKNIGLVVKATPKGAFTENSTFNQSRFDKEKQELAIKNAKKITSYLIDNTSFGAELSLMDTILFKPSDFSGEYRQIIQEERNKIFLSSETQQTSGTKKRTISSNKKIMTLNPPDEFFRYDTDVENSKNFKVKKDAFFEKDGNTTNIKFKDPEFEGITFDVYQIQQTVAHEYGHHLVLHNKDLEQKRFFNKLKEITNPRNANTRWSDFKTIYDYFNVIVETRTINVSGKAEKTKSFTQWDIDKENGTNLPETAIDILKLYRKYFSDNVQTVGEYLDEGLGNKEATFKRIGVILGVKSDSSVRTETITNPTTNTIVKSLLSDVTYDGIIDILTTPSLRNTTGSQNRLVTRIEDEIGDHKIYVNESFKLLPDDLNANVVGTTYFLPSNFEKGTKGVKNVKPLKLGDVFEDELKPNIIEGDTKKENTNRSCNDLPLNAFSLDSINYESTLIYNSVGNYDSNEGALNFGALSKQHDLEFMDLLSYYYSFDELSARLHGLLTFKDSLNRQEVSGCSIQYSVAENRSSFTYKSIGVASNDYLADYALYKSFGIDVFAGDNEVKLYELLRPYKELETTNTIEFNKYEDPKNGESNLHYSYNSFGENPKVGEKITPVTEENANEEVKAWWTVYNLARVRLDDPKKAFLVTLEFDDKDGKKAYRKAQDYNYLNTFTYEGSKLTDLQKTEYTTENEVELLFYLYTARGLFSTDNKYRVADAPSIFDNAPTRVFVDNDGNGRFDIDTDTEVSVI